MGIVVPEVRVRTRVGYGHSIHRGWGKGKRSGLGIVVPEVRVRIRVRCGHSIHKGQVWAW